MRASHTLVALVSALPLLFGAATASAHFVLMTPAPNNPGDASGGKGAPPCGPDSAVAATPTAAMGGHELMLSLKETVRHGGFYRVALSINARTEIPVDNVVYDSANKVLAANGMPGGTSDHADFEATPKFPVLADNLFPHPQTGDGDQVYTSMIMLPNVSCDHCTLQVIEFMTPHGYNAGGGYFYHHCADLKITADAAMPIFDPNNPGTGGGGAGGGPSGGAAGAGGSTTATGGTGGATAGTSGAGGNGGIGAMIGIPGAGGTATSTAGTATALAGTGGTGTTPTTSSESQDSGGCGIATRTQGGASALAALGLLFALVRRRRAA